MRTNINIVWVEDDFSLSVEDCMGYMVTELTRRGYTPQISQFKDLAEVIQYIDDPKSRVDLVVTDYNLDEGELPPEFLDVKNGLDFIAFLRPKWKNMVVLYTNADSDEVKNDYKHMLDKQPLSLFSNVYFIPLDQDKHTVENEFKEADAYFSCNLDELNAMRARFMAEHAEL